MAGGYVGKIGFVDLTTGEIKEERLDDSMAREFIGGYGLGVRILLEMQKGKVDALGPENILGFTTGPLTGTRVPRDFWVINLKKWWAGKPLGDSLTKSI